MLTTCTETHVNFHVIVHYSISVLTKIETDKFYCKSPIPDLMKLDYAVLNLSREHIA